jgi:hypothetical protein
VDVEIVFGARPKHRMGMAELTSLPALRACTGQGRPKQLDDDRQLLALLDARTTHLVSFSSCVPQ